MPRPNHTRRTDPSTITTTTPPHPALPATPELHPPPINAMNAYRAATAAAGVRAASGALPTFNGAAAGSRDFGEGEDFDHGGEDSGEDGEPGEHNEEEYDEEEDELEEEEEEDMPARNASPLPDNLREISSLASWTVSTHKPGCGVAALRHTSPSFYWQSDGPQPHALTLHFFKLVAVIRIRVYLDFGLDESYTPTKMVFLAGMGGNDLVEFASWEGEAPTGWVDIPLEGVGGRNNPGGEGKRRRRRKTNKEEVRGLKGHDSGDDEDYDMNHENSEDYNSLSDDEDDINTNDPTTGNVLKAMVIQMKICENHQNGKDTHVRGFQVFAQDDRIQGAGTRKEGTRKFSHDRVRGDGHTQKGSESEDSTEEEAEYRVFGMAEPDWMVEPEIR